MNKGKQHIGLLLNIAPLYRQSLFKLLESNFACRWIFGENNTDIPECNTSHFADVNTLQLRKGPKNTYWLKGALKLLFGKATPRQIIMTGEIKFLTTWMVLLRNKFTPRKHRKKVILWTHGWYGNESRLQNMVMKLYCSLADRIMFYGNHGRELAIGHGVPATKTLVIHNSLNHDLFVRLRKEFESVSPQKSELLGNRFANPHLPLLCYIGRLSMHKDVDLLLKAQALLCRSGSPVNVLVIGDGPAMPMLKEYVESQGLGANVWFYSACYDDVESAPLIYTSDSCVSPGHIGLTAIHALEMGTPVVTHNDFSKHAPEVEAVIPGITGQLFRRGDVESIAAVLQEIIKVNKTDRMQVREACYSEAGQWTPAYQLSIIEKALHS